MKSSIVLLPFLSFVLGILGLLSAIAPARCDEGMYPISDIGALDLKAIGLQLSAEEVFNPDKICLVDGICRVNGCTGSFVSSDGLIITNHHCAFAAIQGASTPDHDYLNDGFRAASREQEIHAPGYTVRITEGYQDVSAQMLSVVKPGMTFVDRTKALDRQMKQLEKDAEAANPGMRAEVAEMFTGERYLLFLYTYIKDVRLVFAPPQSVGNFGGEVDNWEWPRHTGDFSFMRAYVAPDGSSADYAKENVPYHPKRVIQVAPQGVNEGEFVMLLGYPGRTVRHNTASFLQYEQDVRLPYIVDLYRWQIAAMEAAGADDRAVALKLASRIKSLANVAKRSRGQLKGLQRIPFVKQRRAAEEALQAFVAADPIRDQRAGNVLSDIDAVYREMTEAAALELNLSQLPSAVTTLGVAFTLIDAANERQKDDLERESSFTDKNFDLTRDRTTLRIKDYVASVDVIMMQEILKRLRDAGVAGQMPASLQQLLERDDTGLLRAAESVVNSSKMNDETFVATCFSMSPDELAATNDPAIRMMNDLYGFFLQIREKNKEREGRLSQLYGQLITEKRDFLKTGFVPDANGTLRLTYGRVESYSPEDAVVKTPVTTLKGMLDKVTGVDPFIAPPRIAELHAAREFGRYVHPTLNDVPVALLYSTDSTGGNSGSPILNSRGELVGVNFDRAFEATINDFAWNHDYSRSIGVDIRYVLWLTEKVYGAANLIEEMGIR